MISSSLFLTSIRKLPQQLAHGLRLLPGREVSSFREHRQAATGNVLAHQFPVGQGGDRIFLAEQQQCGHIDGFESGYGIGARRHPVLYLRDVHRRHFEHHALGAVDEVGTRFARSLPDQFRKHEIGKPFGAALEHLVGGLQASVARFRRVGLRARAAQHQASDAISKMPPELEQDVATDRYTREDGTSHVRIVEDTHEIVGMFVHGGRAYAGLRLSVRAEVGHKDAVARFEELRSWHPKFMIGGKRMEENDWRSVTETSVDNFGVATANAIHAGILIERTEHLGLHARDFAVATVHTGRGGAFRGAPQSDKTVRPTRFAYTIWLCIRSRASAVL